MEKVGKKIHYQIRSSAASSFEGYKELTFGKINAIVKDDEIVESAKEGDKL